MLALILDNMSANSFNFLSMNVPVGEYYIEVKAKLTHAVNGEDSQIMFEENPALMQEYLLNPMTNAYVGKGSVTVEETRMIK